MEFITSTTEESFILNDYNEGVFCLTAYDRFDNESDYSCTEASGMLAMQFELLHEANLISFMGIPMDSSIINIFNPLGDNITGVIGQGTASNNLGNDSWVGSLTILEPTSGYWIKLNDPPVESFLVEAYPTDSNINYDLMEGHNLISYVGIDNLTINTTTDLDGDNVCEIVFGDEQGHNNKITYQLKGNIDELDLNIPFNSDTFKTILNFNKDMEEGKLYLSNMGLMKLEFKTDDTISEYFLIRKAETSY